MWKKEYCLRRCFVIPYEKNQSNRVLYILFDILFGFPFRSFFFFFFFFCDRHNSFCKVLQVCRGHKMPPPPTPLPISVWHFGSPRIMYIIFENKVVVAGEREKKCCNFLYPSWKDCVKSSLLFSVLFCSIVQFRRLISLKGEVVPLPFLII